MVLFILLLFFIFCFLIFYAIWGYLKIGSLKNKIRIRDITIENLKTDLHNEKMRNESLLAFSDNSSSKKSRKKGRATGVHYDDFSVLQARKIDGKYYHPIKDMEDNGHPFYKKKVVITGEFEDYPDRNELAELIWSLGADIDTTVSERTEYLIIGEDHGPRKYENAQEFGVKIIDEVDLKKILE